MSDFDEGPRDFQYEKIILEMPGSLRLVYDRMWLYDFEGAYDIVLKLLKTLEKQGISHDDLISKASDWKRKKRDLGGTTPDHSITILAPVVYKLMRMRDDLSILLKTYSSVLAKTIQKYRDHIIVDLENSYLIRYILPKPLKELEYESLEYSISRIFDPEDMELHVEGGKGLIVAKLWLYNMVIDFSLIGNRLNCHVVPPPKLRNFATLRDIVDKFIRLYEII